MGKNMCEIRQIGVKLSSRQGKGGDRYVMQTVWTWRFKVLGDLLLAGLIACGGSEVVIGCMQMLRVALVVIEKREGIREFREKVEVLSTSRNSMVESMEWPSDNSNKVTLRFVVL
jgi:hypothetical protein